MFCIRTSLPSSPTQQDFGTDLFTNEHALAGGRETLALLPAAAAAAAVAARYLRKRCRAPAWWLRSKAQQILGTRRPCHQPVVYAFIVLLFCARLARSIVRRWLLPAAILHMAPCRYPFTRYPPAPLKPSGGQSRVP